MYKKSSLCHLSHTLMAISILLKQLIIVPLKGKAIYYGLIFIISFLRHTFSG